MTSSGSYDVVVVGAGLTGATIASALAQAGLQVVVLEATSRVGGSFKSWPGLAILGTTEPFSDLADRLGEDAALQLWELTRANLDQLAADLRSMEEPVDRVGSLRLAADAAETERLRDSVTRLQAHGYEVKLEDHARQEDLAALNTSQDIRLVPHAFVERLLNHENIVLELESEVHRIHTRSEGDIAVWAHKSYLWAEKVVFANGIHLAGFSDTLEGILDPVRVHTIELQNTNRLRQPLIIDGGHICFLPKGERGYLAGWGFDEQEILQRLTTIADQLCPSARVYRRATSWTSRTPDGLPVVGQFPDQDNVYFASGLGPYGLNLTYIVADEIVNLLQWGQPSDTFHIDRLT
ncbi:MAG: NAD(P)/FAD-dependent oxidoreductase [Anaerolineae bacterium]